MCSTLVEDSVVVCFLKLRLVNLVSLQLSYRVACIGGSIIHVACTHFTVYEHFTLTHLILCTVLQGLMVLFMNYHI